MSSLSILSIKKHSLVYEDISGTFFVFLYVFSFYVAGPITSSMVAGGIALFSLMMNNEGRRWLAICIKSDYFVGMCGFVIALITLGVFYSTIHQTFDFSYIKIFFAQLIHLICGAFIISWIYRYLDVDVNQIIKWIILAYLVQSIIELIASGVPGLASFLLYFNRAEDAHVMSGGVRGVALAASTTWGLGLTYGLAFILYFKHYLMRRVNLLTVSGLMILIVGTFFAGRTGFVGACIGLAYFMLLSKKRVHKKVAIFIYAVFIIYLICQIALIFFYDYTVYAIEFILPWALEPLFNLIDGKGLSTGSTNRLAEMWEVIPTWRQALLGTGNFTNADDSFFMHVDVGILRNLFYWGIGGYAVLIAYEIFTVKPMFKNKTYRNMMLFVCIYLMVGEYKALVIGVNKMILSLLFLMSFAQVLDDNRCRRLA